MIFIIKETTKKDGHYAFLKDWAKLKDIGGMKFINKLKTERNNKMAKKLFKKIMG